MANSTESAKDNAIEKETASVPSEKPKSHDGTLAEQSASSEGSTDEIPPELINAIPEPTRAMVKEIMFAQTGVMRQENPIAKKITAEHITQYLQGSQVQLKEDYKERHEKKILYFLIFLAALIFIVVMVVLLKNQPDMLEKILYTLGGLTAGAFGGYGFGKHQSNDD